MNFQQAFAMAMSKGITFRGRATRPEFWWVFPLYFIGMAIVGRFVTTMGSAMFSIAYAVGALIVLLYALSLMARRLHDRNMSALWLVLILVPTFGMLILLVLCALPGSPGINDYGPDPYGRSNSFSNAGSDRFNNQFSNGRGSNNANSKYANFNQSQGNGFGNSQRNGFGSSQNGFGQGGFNPFDGQSENDRLNEEFKRKIRGNYNDDNKN